MPISATSLHSDKISIALIFEMECEYWKLNADFIIFSFLSEYMIKLVLMLN